MTDTMPTYAKWHDIPESIATKTTLYRDFGLKLAKDQHPVAKVKRYNLHRKHIGYYDLYAAVDCVPKKKPTQAQLKALEQGRYMAELLDLTCVKCHDLVLNRYGETVRLTRKRLLTDYKDYVCQDCQVRIEAQRWAANLFEYGDFLILDTETTDLYGEIIEIGIINAQGETLLNQRIQPQGAIVPAAQAIHGISLDDLQDCPTFPDVYPTIAEILSGQVVVIYHATYDTTCIRQDCERHHLDPIVFDDACAMKWYAKWVGEWSHYHGDYQYQPLNGGHTAISDCLATLERLKEMRDVE